MSSGKTSTKPFWICWGELNPGTLAIVPLAWVLRGKHPAAPHGAPAEKSMKRAVRDAWNDPSFLLLPRDSYVPTAICWCDSRRAE
jgi:hypothetical protein